MGAFDPWHLAVLMNPNHRERATRGLGHKVLPSAEQDGPSERRARSKSGNPRASSPSQAPAKSQERGGSYRTNTGCGGLVANRTPSSAHLRHRHRTRDGARPRRQMVEGQDRAHRRAGATMDRKVPDEGSSEIAH